MDPITEMFGFDFNEFRIKCNSVFMGWTKIETFESGLSYAIRDLINPMPCRNAHQRFYF